MRNLAISHLLNNKKRENFQNKTTLAFAKNHIRELNRKILSELLRRKIIIWLSSGYFKLQAEYFFYLFNAHFKRFSKVSSSNKSAHFTLLSYVALRKLYPQKFLFKMHFVQCFRWLWLWYIVDCRKAKFTVDYDKPYHP